MNTNDFYELKKSYDTSQMPEKEVIKMKEKMNQAKAEKKNKHNKTIITRIWVGAAAAIAAFVILPNTSPSVAYAMEQIPLLGNLISECLKKSGYTNLIMTMNGQEAWDKLTEFKNKGTVRQDVHCIITDIEMPLMDGHRLTKLCKSDDEIKKIPLIIFSSLVNEEMRKKGEQLG